MKFASLKNDYVFKEVISEERVRKQFISDVLKIPMEDIGRCGSPIPSCEEPEKSRRKVFWT